MLKKILPIILILTISFSLFAALPKADKYFKNEIKRGQISIKVKTKGIDITIPYSFSEMYPKYKTKRLLKKIFIFIKLYKKFKIQIEGHTDNIAPRKPSTIKKYPNLKAYSKGRANFVKRYLQALGIKSSLIKVIGLGDTQPIDSNDTEAGRAKNRRVVIKVEFSLPSAGSISAPQRVSPPRDNAPPQTEFSANSN